MAVTPSDVAISLGASCPDPIPDEQWLQWISDVNMLIQDWAARNGYVYAEMSPSALDFVIRETVADRAKNPDGATQVEVSVDDGRVSRRYQTASGTFRVRDEWWDLLRPATASPQGAFSFRLSWQPDTAWCP